MCSWTFCSPSWTAVDARRRVHLLKAAWGRMDFSEMMPLASVGLALPDARPRPRGRHAGDVDVVVILPGILDASKRPISGAGPSSCVRQARFRDAKIEAVINVA